MIFIGQLSPGDRGWCAYLLPQGVTYTKDILELDQVFYERYGSFLFSSKEVSLDSKEKANEFVSSIKSYIASRHASYRHLLWADDFSNPEGICGISFFNNKMTSAAKWRISSSLNLHWEAGSSISYDAARKCLSIKGRGGIRSPMYIAKSYPDGKDGKHYPTQEIRLFLNSGAKGCLELGCLEFDLTLSLNGDFDDLDFGLRYFTYDKINKRVCSQRYPLLRHANINVGLKVRLDPTCYLNHDRNFWAFDRASSPLPFAFVTTMGHGIMMTPVVANSPGTSSPARKVFARKSAAPSDDFYLADPALAPKIDAFLERLLSRSWITNLNRDRNFWAFDWASPPLQSPFITTVDHRDMITPAVADCLSSSAPARMVFARKNATPDDDFYLIPDGDFTLGVENQPSYNATFSLLCGLGATESITFNLKSAPNSGDRLRFKVGMPALSTTFPDDGAVLEEEGSLEGKFFGTSWVTLVTLQGSTTWKNPPTPWYDSQPEGAPLFAKESGDLLKFHQMGIKLTSGEDLYLPLVPYASLQVDPQNGPFDAEGIKNFEMKVLSPARKGLIEDRRAFSSEAGQRALKEPTAKTKYVTPQGFIVTVDDSGTYTEVLLAKTGSPSNVEFKLTNPSTDLQEALQTNQLFLVVTNNGNFGKIEDNPAPGDRSFSNLLSVGGWNFRVNVPASVEGEDFGNVMIFKFCKGTLQDMVKTPDLWAKADVFNDSSKKTALSLWLQDYLEEAIEEAGDSSSKECALFTKLKDIATNEHWNGILLLKADIDSLPSNLGGLMAGMERNKFFAHHLGIEANHIDSVNIDIKDHSSVFGAIYYSDSSYLSAIDGDFYFRVKDLGALFENSALKSFESNVELVMNRILDHPVLRTTTGSSGQDSGSIVLKGSCQKKEGSSTESSGMGEDIIFVMDSDESCSFYLDSNILRKVEVVKAQMSMAEDSASGLSTTRFDFWGFMDFAALKYEVQSAASISAGAKTRSTVLIPLDAASGRGTRPGKGDHHRATLDMEMSNDVWAPPKAFLHTGARGEAGGTEETSADVGTMASETATETKLFDVFSYGNEYNADGSQRDQPRKGLYFSGLGLLISYTKGDEGEKKFSFELSRIAFDLEKSTPRDGSLVKQFGLKIEGTDWGEEENKPDGGGYVKVETKASGPGMSSPSSVWYGLRFRLNMGTLGDLAGKAGLASSLRLAWSAEASGNSEAYSAFVGVKLPGSEGVKLFDLQGFMKLSIGAVRLGCVGNGCFVMTLSSIALKLLGLLKIPPSGATSFYLFGSTSAEEKGLGWYAMYKKG